MAARPWRPATSGRVDGFTCQANLGPEGASSDVSVSVKLSGSPIVLPRSSRQTGDVAVSKLFDSRSVDHGAAVPSITEWSETSAVASSILK